MVNIQGSIASSSGRRTRSSSRASTDGRSSQRAPTPRPSMVGQPPIVPSRKLKRPASGALPLTTPRRTAPPPPRSQPVPSIPLMRGLTGVSSSLVTSGILPSPGLTPLVHSSQLPVGFSLNGTPPLSMPTTNGNSQSFNNK